MNKIEHPKHAFQSNESDFNELRDWFAGMAMQGILTIGWPGGQVDAAALSRSSYIISDAMLEARKQGGTA